MFIKHAVTLHGCNNRVWAYFLSEKGKLALEKFLSNPQMTTHDFTIKQQGLRIDRLEATIVFMNEALETLFTDRYFLKLCSIIQGLDTKRSWRAWYFRKRVKIAPNHGDIFSMAFERAITEQLLISRGGGWYKRGLRI